MQIATIWRSWWRLFSTASQRRCCCWLRIWWHKTSLFLLFLSLHSKRRGFFLVAQKMLILFPCLMIALYSCVFTCFQGFFLFRLWVQIDNLQCHCSTSNDVIYHINIPPPSLICNVLHMDSTIQMLLRSVIPSGFSVRIFAIFLLLELERQRGQKKIYIWCKNSSLQHCTGLKSKTASSV